jgi:hypothetical protein
MLFAHQLNTEFNAQKWITFNEDTMSGPADAISVFIFSPRVAPNKLKQGGSQWRHTHNILDVPQKKKLREQTTWPSDRPVPANSLLCKLVI